VSGPLKFPSPHPWNLTPAEAVAVQQRLRAQVITDDELGPVRTVAGVDVGLEEGRVARAAVAVLSFPGLEPLARSIARRPLEFPYVPGLLSFREMPALLDALERLAELPDLILCDGQGIAHPRRFGIACHLGLICGVPTIGVGKTRLVGRHAEVPEAKGAWVPLEDRGEVVGAVLRTRERVKPLYVSPGHRVSLPTAVEYVLACTTRYRLPETTRWAHRLASG
jgi:deoxyribonuclease V